MIATMNAHTFAQGYAAKGAAGMLLYRCLWVAIREENHETDTP